MPDSADHFRELPNSQQAEQGLLGALLIDNAALDRVGDFLLPEHFFVPVHGRIYSTIITMRERGQIANPLTISQYFKEDEELEPVGGAAYLAELAGTVVSIVNIGDYARVIYDAYIRRSLIRVGEDVVNTAFEHDVEKTPAEQIEAAEASLYELAEHGEAQRGFEALSRSLTRAIDYADAAKRRESHVSGVTIGLSDLDRKLGGLQRSDLIILAGRPSMGKTALATNMAFNAAAAYRESDGLEGAPVGFMSLEMSAEQLATRILSEHTEIASDKIRRGDIRDDDFDRIVKSAVYLNEMPLFIDDTPALSISAVRTRARRMKRQHNLGLLVVDYLQLLRGSTARGAENRVLEISEISRGLKAIAKELEIPVLALSQLSRQVEQREDKRPQLADLRESGSIEQDADVVMFVFREQYYLDRAEPKQRENEGMEKYNERHNSWMRRKEEVHNVAEVIIAKQRHGPIGTVKLFFDGNFTRFADLDPYHAAAAGHGAA